MMYLGSLLQYGRLVRIFGFLRTEFVLLPRFLRRKSCPKDYGLTVEGYMALVHHDVHNRNIPIFSRLKGFSSVFIVVNKTNNIFVASYGMNHSYLLSRKEAHIPVHRSKIEACIEERTDTRLRTSSTIQPRPSRNLMTDDCANAITMDVIPEESQQRSSKDDYVESKIKPTHSEPVSRNNAANKGRLSMTDRRVTTNDRASNEGLQAFVDFHTPFLGETKIESKRMLGTRQTSMRDKAASAKNIQPGRNRRSMITETITAAVFPSQTHTASQLFDFFKKLQLEQILLQIALSCLYTAFVMYVCKDEWKDKLQVSTLAVSVLGGFLSFALVFRTQTCYSRWWEGRTQWGIMIYASIHTAQQGRSWIQNEELLEDFMVYCILFSYICKAMLRGNSLSHDTEEGPELVASGMITQEELDDICEYGWQPMYCIERLRGIMNRAFQEPHGTNLTGEGMRNGAMKSMEDSFRVLATNLGACLKVKSTGLPVTYDLFTFILLHMFFVVANLAWAPKMLWYTPIITGVIVFLMNTIIVIGNQMLGAFELQWAGLPLQKFCTIIENEINCIQKRHARHFDRNNNH